MGKIKITMTVPERVLNRLKWYCVTHGAKVSTTFTLVVTKWLDDFYARQKVRK